MTQSKKKRAEDDQPPADLAAKPTLQPQRRRVWRACESCRRKKIKCDGTEPTCSQCLASASQCTWVQTKDRAALSRHYVQELEARLLQMESLFAQVAPLMETLGQNPDVASSSGGARSSLVSSNAVAPLLSRLREQAQEAERERPIKVEDDVAEHFSQLALDEHGHLRWLGGSSTMSLVQSFRAATANPFNERVSPMEEDPYAPGPSVNKFYFPAAVFFGKVRALPLPDEVEYPDRDLADMLIEAYFTQLHCLMPVVDKPSFLRNYARLMENPLLARTETAFVGLVFAVFACASRIVDDDRLKNGDAAGMGMIYYERALILHYISHASIQIGHVQCFVLLSSFLCSVNCLPQAWLLVGQAVRAGQDLGLHRSPKRLVLSPIEKETRRKVWWSVYTMDRMLAVALGRPLGVADSDCDVELPIDVEDQDLPDYFAASHASPAPSSPSLMAGFISLATLYIIAGRVLREVYALDKSRESLEPDAAIELRRTVEALDQDLMTWCNDLPAVFKAETTTERQLSMGAVLCSHYYSVLTVLHRNLIPVKKGQAVPATSATKAISSARSCIHLAPSIRNHVPPSHHVAFFIQHLFSSAVIILLYAMGAPNAEASQAAMEEAKGCLSALEAWEGLWPGARKCRELLVDLMENATQAVKISVASGEPPTTSMNLNTPGSSGSASPLSMASPAALAPSRLARIKPSQRRKSKDSRSPIRRAPYPVPERSSIASTLQKLGREDPDEPRSPSLNPAQKAFTSTLPGPPSSHSSPASSHDLPSPIMGARSDGLGVLLRDTPSGSQPILTQNTENMASSSANPFEFGYGPTLSSTSQFQPASFGWNGQGGDFDLFGQSTLNPSSFDNGSATQPMYDDTFFSSFGGLRDVDMSAPASSANSAFAASGLPFRGLDYIRNYTPNSGELSGVSVWPALDASTFGLAPDIPFSLGDAVEEDRDGS